MIRCWKLKFPFGASPNLFKKISSIFLIFILLSSVASFSSFESADAQTEELAPPSPRLGVIPGEFIVKLKSFNDPSQIKKSSAVAQRSLPELPDRGSP